MKKIVILCNHFAPDNTIAAVRLTKLARYLYQHGYQITVIAEQKNDEIVDEILQNDAEGIKVLRIANSKQMKRIGAFYKKMIGPIKNKKYDNLDNRMRINSKTGKYEFYPFETAYPMIGSMDYLVELLRQYDLFRMSKHQLRENARVDYIFTSYGDFFGLFAGKYLHKRDRTIPWIFDIRDAICRYKFTPQYVRWVARLHESYIWREADVITAVSKGICSHVPKKYRNKVYCVTNGYDRREREGILSDNRSREQMRLVYTGSMYGGLQNLSPVFGNIRKLIDEKKINNKGIEFLFAGKKSAFEIFESQAKKYNLDDNCVYYGKVTRKEALKLQMEADILLVSSFDYQTDVGGVITGKALEYMSANKPIVAIINGDIEHSELAEIIRSANLGFAYEESHHGKDDKELYQYLLEKYQEFQEKGKIEHEPKEEILAKFDYQYLGKKMMKIIERVY